MRTLTFALPPLLLAVPAMAQNYYLFAPLGSGFSSQNITSPFPDQNALFDASKAANAAQQYKLNELQMQLMRQQLEMQRQQQQR